LNGMLQRRTDLALEARELWNESAEQETKLEGVKAEETTREGFPVTTVRILNEKGAEALGKPIGNYVTLELDGFFRREQDGFSRAARALAAELTALISVPEGASALVVGLGNRAITPDAIGPKVADHTMVTRHLVEQMPEHFGAFRPVSALAAGVLGTTGVESGELVRALCEKIKPACVIAVDALASRSVKRLCRTVQIADTGIIPGSGVGNHRAALNKETLGVPVIALGVPTVVDAATIAVDLLEEAGRGDLDPSALAGVADGLMVTPREIDSQVSDVAKVIGYGINLALHSGLTVEDVEMFLS
jgi:spore protease